MILIGPRSTNGGSAGPTGIPPGPTGSPPGPTGLGPGMSVRGNDEELASRRYCVMIYHEKNVGDLHSRIARH